MFWLYLSESYSIKERDDYADVEFGLDDNFQITRADKNTWTREEGADGSTWMRGKEGR